MKKIIELHRFFLRESHQYLADNPLRFKTKQTYFPRGEKTYWYHPLSLKHRLYFPIAYIKFMYFSLFR